MWSGIFFQTFQDTVFQTNLFREWKKYLIFLSDITLPKQTQSIFCVQRGRFVKRFECDFLS